MTNLYERTMSLTGLDVSGLAADDLRTLVRELLAAGIHGISFSPYVEGQGPGTQLDAGQIRQRLEIVVPSVRWIRTFSSTEGNELIPELAKEYGMKTMVGVWLDDDLEHNELELATAIELANAGYADILAVGNEVLLRGELTEDQLLDYLGRARRGAPGVDIGYVDAYFAFIERPRVTAACDVLLANCYPFWEGCPAEYALLYLKDMYWRVVNVAGGKRVIVSETGWPNTGTAVRGAIPSYENAVKYFVDTCRWAEHDNIELFYFSAFDETWKVDVEGDVGAFWGLWDKEGNSKYV